MWENLKVSQFLSLYDIETNSKANFVEKQTLMLAVIENKKDDDYDNYKYANLLQEFDIKTKFLETEPECKAVDVIEVNGNRYKFIHEIKEITAGQYIDFNAFCGDIANLHKVAACFFRPMKGNKVLKYGKADHEKIAEDLLDARYVDIQGCMLFFCQLLIGLINDTEISLHLPIQTREKITHLISNGVGLEVQKM